MIIKWDSPVTERWAKQTKRLALVSFAAVSRALRRRREEEEVYWNVAAKGWIGGAVNHKKRGSLFLTITLANLNRFL